MSARSSLRLALALSFILPACAAFSQAVPAIPPASDPSFWGKKNTPYTLKLTYADGSSTPPMKAVVSDVSRDSAGRVRMESFYANGQPMAVSIADPVENTKTIMYLVEKRAIITPLPRATTPPPGKGWTVEPLPSRVIDGIAAQGFRFTITLPSPPQASAAPVTTIEEEWISKTLGLVLQRTSGDGTTNSGTQSVSHFKEVEPDPALFKIDLTGYSIQQFGTPSH